MFPQKFGYEVEVHVRDLMRNEDIIKKAKEAACRELAASKVAQLVAQANGPLNIDTREEWYPCGVYQVFRIVVVVDVRR